MNKQRDPELVTYRCPRCGMETSQPACASALYHGCPKWRGRTVTLERVE